jgi:uncharacterized damage-inducible protein DinB
MVLPDEVRQRIVSYLSRQAGKDTSAICDLISEERSRLLALLEGVSDEQAAFAPAAGQWSIVKIVGHVVSAERGVAAIIGRLAGVLPETEGRTTSDPEADGDRSLSELRSRLSQTRQELLEVVAQIADDSSLEAKHDHPFFGALNWKEWLAFQRVHDRDHVGQIEAIQQFSSYPTGA